VIQYRRKGKEQTALLRSRAWSALRSKASFGFVISSRLPAGEEFQFSRRSPSLGG